MKVFAFSRASTEVEQFSKADIIEVLGLGEFATLIDRHPDEVLHGMKVMKFEIEVKEVYFCGLVARDIASVTREPTVIKVGNSYYGGAIDVIGSGAGDSQGWILAMFEEMGYKTNPKDFSTIAYTF